MTNRLSIGIDALTAALGALTRAVERRQTIPVLSNVLIEATGGLLRLTTSDLDIWVTTTISLGDALTPDAAITVPVQLLQDIARKLPKGAEADLTWSDADATLACGKARYRINTLPAADYPSLDEPEWTARFAMPATELKRILEKVAFAMSNEEVRYYLNGAYLHLADVAGAPQLVTVATDGHRLSKVSIAAPADADGMPGIIIPRKAVGEIIRLLDGRDDAIELSVCPAKLAIKAGTTRLITKLVDGTFPDYERVIPKSHDRFATVDADALAAAADRVSIVSGERGKAVRITFAEGSLTLEVKNPDAGDAEEEIGCEWEGDDLTTGYNARYLVDALKSLGTDTIRFALGDAGAAAVLTPAASRHAVASDHLVVVMPIRIG